MEHFCMLWKWCMDDIKMGFWDKKVAKRLFQKLVNQALKICLKTY